MMRRPLSRLARTTCRALALLAGMCLVPDAARADVTVRSGEHPGHSRLVLDFGSLPGWELDPRKGGYTLRFDRAQSDIRLDRVFYFIPRTRLTDLRVVPGNLGMELDIGCDCRVEASVTRSRALVIDIHDAAADGDAGGIRAMTDGPVLLLAGTKPDLHPKAPDESPDVSFSPVPRPPRAEVPVLPFTGSASHDAPPYGSGLTRALAEQLARAASQGLVDAGRDVARSGSAHPETGHAAGGGGEDKTESDAAAPDNIRFRNGFDWAAGGFAEDGLPQIETEAACPDARLYAVERWSDGRSAQAQIAALRSGLVGEFDRVNRTGALKLARLYVHLSFGAEARAVVHQLLPDDPAALALLPLSRLIERGETGAGLARFGECAGNLPLWAVLDENPDEATPPVRAQAVLLAFSGLPTHLRKLLGYRLAARFAARGDYESAEIIRATLERIAQPSDPALVLSSVHTSTVEDVAEDTKAALEELALSLRPEAAEALLLNIDGRLTRGERIPLDLIDTAAAISFELAGSAEGRKVKMAEIRARFSNGDFDAAFDELHSAVVERYLKDDQAEALWQTGLESLLRDGTDAEFLEHAFGTEVDSRLDVISAEVRQSLAERLLTLGFPDRASRFAPSGPSSNDGLFAARLAHARGNLARAIDLAAMHDDQSAKRLLGGFLVEAGRFEEAHAVYSTIGDQDAARESAWRAGFWQEVANDGVRPRSPAAEAILATVRQPSGEQDDPPRDASPTIEDSGAVVDESANLRDVLEALLANVPSPDG